MKKQTIVEHQPIDEMLSDQEIDYFDRAFTIQETKRATVVDMKP